MSTIRTRGSATLDKAQRRLANLISIDEYIDLGNEATIQNYRQKIEQTRTALDSYNTLLSNVDEARRTVTELEEDLKKLSDRMLSGIASRYGRDSKEYSKAGGTIRKGGTGRRPKASNPTVTTANTIPLTNGLMNGSSNGSSNGSNTNKGLAKK